MPFERRPREMHKATCGDCGNECEIPFEPRNDKPVYCNECFPNHKPERSSGRFGGRSAGGYGRNNRDGGRFRRDRPPREMHKATCGDCGNECEIPFEPRNDKPVYCNECFPNHKPERSSGRFGGRSAGGYGRNNRDGGRFRRDRPPREMHKATCGDCGNECEIPFEPRNDKPVYCNECFPNHK